MNYIKSGSESKFSDFTIFLTNKSNSFTFNLMKLGEGLINTGRSAADSIGISGLKPGWDLFQDISDRRIISVPVSAGAGMIDGIETFVAPNTVRDFITEDNVSTGSEYLKSGRAVSASILLDAFSWAGAVGVGILTKQMEAAIVTKVGLNAATSMIVRTADSIQRRKIATT